MTTYMTSMTLDAYLTHEEHAASGTERDTAFGEVSSQSFVLRASDGHELGATFASNADPPRAVVVLASAMGVRRRFYAPFARYLAASGLATLTLDYRGIGDSRPQSLRGFATTLHDWAELDLAAAVADARGRAPEAPLLWVGHSVGGQLMGFVPGAGVSAALFVGSQSGYWRHWDGFARVKMASLWHAAIPGAVALAGYFPSNAFGLGEDLPAGVATEWAEWGRDPDYLLVHARERKGAEFLRYTGPLRALSFSDDPLAPRRAVDALVSYYPFARSEVVVVRPEHVGVREIGHFGFFRPTLRDSLWHDAREWLLAHTREARPSGNPRIMSLAHRVVTAST